MQCNLDRSAEASSCGVNNSGRLVGMASRFKGNTKPYLDGLGLDL
ncbi:hypothetical protein EV13_2004 [Prochlorococcus sp. MIT 0702]|nr:hypothetical protein EV13_2004 [Prochlorococcus sp. MIT 0702]KGG28164.1 hypothetical protein EV12_0913 [Prochlorococcus sp. MIT 0701]KGG37214.1 hypothetical protein EV14_0005 [Prochlorococcus sp. MIT 0703]